MSDDEAADRAEAAAARAEKAAGEAKEAVERAAREDSRRVIEHRDAGRGDDGGQPGKRED